MLIGKLICNLENVKTMSVWNSAEMSVGLLTSVLILCLYWNCDSHVVLDVHTVLHITMLLL